MAERLSKGELDRIFGYGGDDAPVSKAAIPPPGGKSLVPDEEPFFLDVLFAKQRREDLQAVSKSAPATPWDIELWPSDSPRITPRTSLEKRAPSAGLTIKLTGDWYRETDQAGNLVRAWHRSLGENPASFDAARISTVNHQ